MQLLVRVAVLLEGSVVRFVHVLDVRGPELDVRGLAEEADADVPSSTLPELET